MATSKAGHLRIHTWSGQGGFFSAASSAFFAFASALSLSDIEFACCTHVCPHINVLGTRPAAPDENLLGKEPVAEVYAIVLRAVDSANTEPLDPAAIIVAQATNTRKALFSLYFLMLFLLKEKVVGVSFPALGPLRPREELVAWSRATDAESSRFAVALISFFLCLRIGIQR